jgi:hypothetical protein
LLRFQKVRALEDAILLQTWHIDALPPGAEDLIDIVTRDVFGNVYADTEAIVTYPALGDEEWIEDLADYDTDHLSDDAVVAYFLPLGLDFREDRGHPMRSTIFLARQAEAACKGIAGKIPEENEADERDWGARLQKEAQDFKKKRAS